MNYIKTQFRSSCPALQYLTSFFFFFFFFSYEQHFITNEILMVTSATDTFVLYWNLGSRRVRRNSCRTKLYLCFFFKQIKIHWQWRVTFHSLLRWIYEYLSEVTEQTPIFQLSIRFGQYKRVKSFYFHMLLRTNSKLLLACRFHSKISFKMESVGEVV